jgi:flap endonuclease-1
MGLQIGDIVPRHQVNFKDLKGKTLAVDAFNALYQFLTSIRQPDGTPLMDTKRRITSHLSGLFYRTIALLHEGIRLIYVFDGEYSPLKGKTHEQRQAAKNEAAAKYEEAVEAEDVDAMAKYAGRFVRLTSEMITESKELLRALGVAVVQAPGEGEMQCAELVKSGQAWAVASQDYDALAVGAPRLLQNATLSKTRRTVSGVVYIAPELIEYTKVLNELNINADQFICLAILVGTDFNPGGVKGIGPKKALALVREKKYPVHIFRAIEERVDFDWPTVFELFKKPQVSKEKAVFPKLDTAAIFDILVEQHDFSRERVQKQLDKLLETKKAEAQQQLF